MACGRRICPLLAKTFPDGEGAACCLRRCLSSCGGVTGSASPWPSLTSVGRPAPSGVPLRGDAVRVPLPRDRKPQAHVGEPGAGFSADDESRVASGFVLEAPMPAPPIWLCLCVCASAERSERLLQRADLGGSGLIVPVTHRSVGGEAVAVIFIPIGVFLPGRLVLAHGSSRAVTALCVLSPVGRNQRCG